MVKKILSPSFSFKGWNIWEWIKGRKRMAITVIATILGFIITDQATVAVAAGGIVEAGYAIIDYFAKKK